MRGGPFMDVVKVWLYAVASVALGAWLAPLLYNAGMALVDVSSGKQTNGFLEWLAGICRAAEFSVFFGFSLVIAAGILFLPAVSLLGGGQMGMRPATRELRLPQGARTKEMGQRLLPNPHGLRQSVVGFFLVTLLFLLIAGVLFLAGVLEWKSPGPRIFELLLRGLFVAFALAVLQEFLFRGIALGIFLRAMRPGAALGLSAVFFALVHFISPPPGLNVTDPDAAGVGFELLGKIVAQFAEPRCVFGIFSPLLALGFVLAYARWRTASLLLPIGLHTGWIFVNGLLENAMQPAAATDSFIALVFGIVSLAGIVVAGVLANFLTTDPDGADPSEN
jgi:uncharacterized protein